MAIEVEKSNLNINQIIANKRDKAIIEGDCIVPDVKPDILEVISASGVINIYKKEVGDGKIRIDGSISTYIMYTGSDENSRSTRSMNHTLDFSQIISVDNVTSDMNSQIQVTLDSIDCRIINERKLNIKANVNFDVKVFTSSNVEFVNNVNVRDIQKLENTVNVNSVIGMGTTKTSVKEVISIDNTDNLAEILKVNAHIVNMDTKTSYNKTLTKADINLKMMYLTEDGRCNTVSKTFPIMGFIDMKDITEDNVCDSNIEIKNMLVKPNGGDEHSISVEIELEISVIAYERRDINVIQDLYSPSMNLSFAKKNVKTIQNKMICRGINNFNQREMLNIGDEKVYDIDTRVIVDSTNVVKDAVDINGNIEFTFMHSTNQMTGIASKVISVPFNYKLPVSNINQNANVDLRCNVTNENFNIMPGSEVELRLDMEFVANISNFIDVNVIENVTENETKVSNDVNMVIYFTKPDDNLWKIAKRFNSTTKTIMETNNLTEQSLKVGTQLFITRYTG